MIRKSLVAAIAAIAVGPALGETQLERSLGVPAGAYSLAELVQLKQAMEDQDRTRIAFIERSSAHRVDSSRSNVGARELTTVDRTAGGPTQLERSLGIPAGAYSLAELVQLKHAMEGEDRTRIADILDRSAALTNE